MTKQQESLAEGWQFFHLGQLPAAIRIAQGVSSQVFAPHAQLLLARCLFKQGRFRQAETIYSKALKTLPSNSDLAWEMRLWRAFLQIYLASNSTPILEESRGALTKNKSPRLRGLAQSLLGRAKKIAVAWHLAPPSDLVEAKRLLSEAVNSYHCSDDRDAALATLLKLGELHLLSKPDPAKAQSIFQQAHDQAQTDGNPVRQAEVTLRLAELDFDATLPQRAIRAMNHKGLITASYHQALCLYEAVGHGFGPADVLLSLGSRLIKAGFDGSKEIEQARLLYSQVDHLSGICNALLNLSTWHMQQGEVSQSLDCRQKAATIAQEMDCLLAQAIASMGIGDYYFRTGDYARALAAYEQVEKLAVVPSVQAMRGLELTNAYILMNLHDRAETACRQAINTLRKVGAAPVPSLSLAYYILGNVLSAKGNWAGAIPIWREGLAVDEACDNRFARAEKLTCIAQATVMQHYNQNASSIPDKAYEKAMDLYNQALELLQILANGEATAAVASTYQEQGQTAFACRRPFEALKYLEHSRNTYATLGAAMQTATTDSLLGLVYYDLGNQGYSDFYVEAKICYERALSYFQNAQMLDTIWKICFYLADVDFMQSFRSLTGEEQQARLRNADCWLEKAAADIELVRGRYIESIKLSQEVALPTRLQNPT